MIKFFNRGRTAADFKLTETIPEGKKELKELTRVRRRAGMRRDGKESRRE